MGHWTQEDVPPGREEFVRENATAVVEQKDLLISRLRDRVRKLEASQRCLKERNAALQRQIEGHCQRIAAQSELLSQRAEKDGCREACAALVESRSRHKLSECTCDFCQQSAADAAAIRGMAG